MLSATLYNAYTASSAICAGVQTGLLEAVRKDRKVDVCAFSIANGLDDYVMHAVCESMAGHRILDIVQTDQLVVAEGPEFDDIYRNKGYFLWLVRGYGDMLSRVGELADIDAAFEAANTRCGRSIAQSGRDYGAQFVDPIVTETIAGMSFSVMADLGCGSANRVIHLARLHPTKRFVGVEMNAGAVEVARAAVAESGMSDRVEIVHDDVRRLRDREVYQEVDAVLSFFLGHDFWPRENCLATLTQIRDRLPNAGHFLLADTYHSATVTGEAPIFTSGFELTHAVMRQKVPTVGQWEELFVDSPWKLERRIPLDIAYSEIFHLTPEC
jgi:SAM-dependent methyltransferase